MTAAATEPLPRLDEALEALKSRGLRLTPQRIAIVTTVLEADGHLSAEGLLAKIESSVPNVNLSTVYRTLAILEEAELVGHAHLGHGEAQYFRPGEDHYHLHCNDCDRVIEVDPGDLRPVAKKLADRYGFEPDFGHFAIPGRCEQCSAEG